jgi:hypothetical protein
MKPHHVVFALPALALLSACSVVGRYEFRRPWVESLEIRGDHTFIYGFSSDEGGSAYEVSGTWAKVGPREIVTSVTWSAAVSNRTFPHGAKWRVTMRGIVAESHVNSLQRRGR